MINIGERIKNRREALNLRLEDVGRYVGVNKATVQRYETGEIDIKRTTAIKLASALRTTPAYIMGWSDDPNKNSMDECHFRLSLSKKEIIDFRKRLKMQRMSKEFSIEQLANSLNVDSSLIELCENGTPSDLNLSFLNALSVALQCSIQYLLGWSDDSKELNITSGEKQVIVEYRKADDVTKEMVHRVLHIEEKRDSERMA